MQHIELGLDTFGDVTVDADGQPVPQPQVIRNVVEEAVLADQLGLDFFGVGEHHREDFAVSAPEVVLAAIAGRTERIRLGSAVTVLSSDDPVRVFQRFATLDAAVRRTGRGHPRPGLVHRVVPALRLRPRATTRCCSRRSSTCSPLLARRGARHVVGRDPRAAARPAGVSRRPSIGPADLGRRRRQPGIGRAGRPLRPPADARHHRRRPAAVRPVRRPLPPGPGRARPAVAADRRSTAPATSPRPTSRRARSCGRTTGRCTPASAPSGAGRR